MLCCPDLTSALLPVPNQCFADQTQPVYPSDIIGAAAPRVPHTGKEGAIPCRQGDKHCLISRLQFAMKQSVNKPCRHQEPVCCIFSFPTTLYCCVTHAGMLWLRSWWVAARHTTAPTPSPLLATTPTLWMWVPLTSTVSMHGGISSLTATLGQIIFTDMNVQLAEASCV